MAKAKSDRIQSEVPVLGRARLMSSHRKERNDEPSDQLTLAMAEAERAPGREDFWVKAEELAAADQRPDEVARLFTKVLRGAKDPALVESVGKRAVRFHDEWFGAETKGLEGILERVLAAVPACEWALRRSSVLYTVSERWNDL